MSHPTIGHMDPAFIQVMGEIRDLLQYAFQTRNRLSMPVSAPGSAGMETCFANLVEAGDTVVVATNGVFGGRMRENVQRCGGTAVVVENEWGKPVDPNKVDEALAKHPQARILAFVHAETSTGVESDAALLAEIAHRRDALVVVDAVTSLAGSPLRVDDWQLDAVYSGSQKCLSCIPGISPVTFSERAVSRILGRKSPIQSWFMDLKLVMEYWGHDSKRVYHHTAPVNSLYALHEALLMLSEEGIEQSWQRHRDNHERLKTGLEEMGLEFFVAESCRLPQLNAVRVPRGIDDGMVREKLLHDYGLEIGAGLGPLAGSIWRIGLMGHSSSPENVEFCLGALASVLDRKAA